MCGQKKLFSSIRPRRVRIYFLLRTSKFIHIYIHSDLFFFLSSRVSFFFVLYADLSAEIFLPKYKKKKHTTVIKSN
jgi:hypothetical protein